MMPGPNIIIQCPNSDQMVKKPTLNSGNTIGGRVWSDGYTFYPMLPRFPEITRCDDGPFFWVDEAKEVGKIDFGDDNSNVPDEWKQAKRIRFLTVEEYLEAIEKGMGRTQEEKLHLRHLAWWAANDPLRKESDNTAQKSPFLPGTKARKNLEQLVTESWLNQIPIQSSFFKNLYFYLSKLFSRSSLKRLTVTDPNKRLMKAEALRQLGRFEEALTTLQAPFPEDLTKVADWMRRLVKERDSLVRELFETR